MEGAVVTKATFNTDGTEKAATVVKEVTATGGVAVYDNKKAGALDFFVNVAEKTAIHI